MTNLKKLIRENVVADKITFKKDGTVEFRDFYFYRHGNDETKVAARIERELRKLGLKVTVLETEDRWAPWPRDSYFRVLARVQFDMDDVKIENETSAEEKAAAYEVLMQE